MRTEDGAPWRPVLEGALAERARTVVEELAEALAATAATQRGDSTLARGEAGLAVALATLADVIPGRGLESLAMTCLERAFEGLAARPLGPSLYAGFPGIAWAAEHLRGRLFDSEEDPVAPVDEALEDLLGTESPRLSFDLVDGLVGLGVYALERRASRPDTRLLERVVTHLANRARRTDDGLVWLEQYGKRQSTGTVNLGMAHGVAGVVALLAAACREGIAAARPLLDGTWDWLLARRLPPGGEACFSQVTQLQPGPPSTPARAAWCYGDAGMSLALLSAARSTGNAQWERTALEVAHVAARLPMERCSVVDAGVCHGAAGLGHIFNRLHQATGEAPLAEASRTWFTRALDLRRPGTGVAGFRVLEPESDAPHDDPGLLTGAAGVALALASAAWPVVPSWDRFLLAELPRPGAASKSRSKQQQEVCETTEP